MAASEACRRPPRAGEGKTTAALQSSRPRSSRDRLYRDEEDGEAHGDPTCPSLRGERGSESQQQAEHQKPTPPSAQDSRASSESRGPGRRTVEQALPALPPLLALADKLLEQADLLDLLGVDLARRDALGAPARCDVRQRVEADKLRAVDEGASE